VGILACERLRDRFPIRNLVLVAPALWKQAPPIVQLSDRIPDTMYACLLVLASDSMFISIY
jgi:hypothetical protein